MPDRRIIVDSCKNGDLPCPMFDDEMATCKLSKVAQTRDTGEQEPVLPKNTIPFPENCPLKAGPYTGPWTIELIYPDG